MKMCEEVTCWPVRTNAAFLANLLGDPEFLAGEADTGLIARELDSLLPSSEPDETVLQSVALVVVDRALGGRPQHLRETYLSRPNSPWSWKRGFRLNAAAMPTIVRLDDGQQVYDVAFQEIVPNDADWVDVVDDGYLITEAGNTFVFTEARASGVAGAGTSDGAIVSPMPGKIIALEVAAGDTVTKGQKLLTLEAMKMEHSLTAPFDGKVAELNAAAGAQVSEGALLVRIEKGEGA